MKKRDIVITIIVLILIVLGILSGSLFNKEDEEVALRDNPFGPLAGDREWTEEEIQEYESQYVNSPFYSRDQIYDSEAQTSTDNQTQTSTRIYKTSDSNRLYREFERSSYDDVYDNDNSNFNSENSNNTNTSSGYDPYNIDWSDYFSDYTRDDYTNDEEEDDYTSDEDSDDDSDECDPVKIVMETLGVSEEVAKVIVLTNPILLDMCIAQTVTGAMTGGNSNEDE